MGRFCGVLRLVQHVALGISLKVGFLSAALLLHLGLDRIDGVLYPLDTLGVTTAFSIHQLVVQVSQLEFQVMFRCGFGRLLFR